MSAAAEPLPQLRFEISEFIRLLRLSRARLRFTAHHAVFATNF